MKPIRLSLVAVALASVLAACGATAADGGSDPDPAAADATVTAADMAFDPGTVSVAAGEAFTIAFDEKGTALNFSWENTQVSVPVRPAKKG